jgi:hypothetical protein
MGSRWFNSVVVLFWLSTMTWLVVAKVVPPLRRGDPPSYQSMYSAGSNDNVDEQPVGWEMTLNGKPLGWAVNKVARMGTGVTEVRSRIHFDRIPLQEFSPTWTKILLNTIAPPDDGTQMDVSSSLEIDPLGHLNRFNSSLRVAGMRDSVRISGVARASRLIINVESGSTQSPSYEAYLPRDALVADELSPQSRITGLQLNQQWTVPVFSPLRPPTNPVEILQAKVESRQPIEWEGKVTGAYEVVYRSDSGSVLYSSKEARSKLWVRDDGLVLKQEVNVLGSRLVFNRMNVTKSAEIALEADRDEQRQRELRKERYQRMQEERGNFPWDGHPRYIDGFRGDREFGRPGHFRHGMRQGNFSNNPPSFQGTERQPAPAQETPPQDAPTPELNDDAASNKDTGEPLKSD